MAVVAGATRGAGRGIARALVAAGGTTIPVRVDHAVESEVEALFARVEDPLVGAYGWFWDADLTNAAKALENALLSHIITAKHAAKLMIKARRGLIVEVTEGDFLGAGGNPVKQVVKLALKGNALAMAAELHPHGVAAVAITPGFLRSESMLEHFGVTEANWREGGKKDKNFLTSGCCRA